MNLAFIFPGQGSQKPCMGRDLYEKYPEGKRVFDDADSILGFSLSKTIFEGTEEELKKTSVTQVAILTVEIAIFEILKEKGITPAVCAGHSLGEYAALIASGAITFEQALLLVQKRALFMEEAGKKIPSGMLAIIDLSQDKIEEICREISLAGIAELANFNSPCQIVISGELKAMEEAARLAEERGAKKCVLLAVSGAFHSRIMDEASKKLADEMKNIRINPPRIPFIANFSGDYIQDPEEIRLSLIKQVNNSVKWVQTMEKIKNGEAGAVVEIGPGKVLSGLWRRFDNAKPVLNVESVETLKKLEEFRRN